MEGTCLGEWLETTFQKELFAMRTKAETQYNSRLNLRTQMRDLKPKGNYLYGMTWHTVEKKITVDGACGFGSIIKIAETIGVRIMRVYTDKNTNVYLVEVSA
jgi:hypothetical protein